MRLDLRYSRKAFKTQQLIDNLDFGPSDIFANGIISGPWGQQHQIFRKKLHRNIANFKNLDQARMKTRILMRSAEMELLSKNRLSNRLLKDSLSTLMDLIQLKVFILEK